MSQSASEYNIRNQMPDVNQVLRGNDWLDDLRGLFTYVNMMTKGCNLKNDSNSGPCAKFDGNAGSGNLSAMNGDFSSGPKYSVVPLGNAYFKKTDTKCKNGKDKYIYINNRSNSESDKGIIPSIGDDIANLGIAMTNIDNIVAAAGGEAPDCFEATGIVGPIQGKNMKAGMKPIWKHETNWISCNTHPSIRNQLHGANTCKESFINMDNNYKLDTFQNFYVLGFSSLFLFMVYNYSKYS